MVRYPHILDIEYQQEGYFDGTGDYHSGTAVEVSIKGRAEANGKGNLVRLNDGSQIVYSWMFFSGPEDEDIPYNAKAELKEDNETIWEGTVKGIAKRQRGTQIWL